MMLAWLVCRFLSIQTPAWMRSKRMTGTLGAASKPPTRFRKSCRMPDVVSSIPQNCGHANYLARVVTS